MDSTPQIFNTSGPHGRDCPLCYRPGSLIGRRDGADFLRCSGCYTVFRLIRGDGAAILDTLERIHATPIQPKKARA